MVDVDHDAVGIAYQLVIVEPGVVAVEHRVALQIRGGVDDGGPPRQVALLEVVARIVAIQGLDGAFAVEALLPQVLLGHHQAESVDGQAGVFSCLEDGSRVGGRLRQGVEVVGRAGSKQSRADGYVE